LAVKNASIKQMMSTCKNCDTNK